MTRRIQWTLGLLVIAAVAVVAAVAWWRHQNNALPPGLFAANGRVEAIEVDIATKYAGRVAEILVREGDVVQQGQVLARMDTEVLQAQLRETEAGLERAGEERKAAEAQALQSDTQCAFAERELKRSQKLFSEGHLSEEQIDRSRTTFDSARAECTAAAARLVEAEAGVTAARATVDRIRAELDDAVLAAPRGGQVLYRLAEPGEVLAAGGKLLTLIDLNDVYMTVFLPARVAGRVRVGSEARLLLDALPDRPVPATVSFVADKAQFTPKHVETAEEREKLMFRAKISARANPGGVLKPGMPGVAYLREIDGGEWPAALK
jgi:HlyD family secretion protein